MSKTIISIGDRDSKTEVAHILLKTSVKEARIHAMKIANELGYNDLLRYQVWVGSEQAYNTYNRYTVK